MKRNLLFALVISFAVVTLWAQQAPQAATVPQASAAEVAPVGTTLSAVSDQSPQASEAETAASGAALLLDVGDVLDVRVFDTPELSGKLRVDSRGDITLPVGGTVAVKGLTPEQVQAAVEQRFRQREILRDPHVEIFVLEYATQRVTVMGEVKMPGVYPVGGKRGVLDLVSIAGGPTSSASKTAVLTHKKSPGEPIAVDLSGSLQNGPQPQVEPGDRIVVMRAGIVYVVGDVGRPGGYLIENQDTLTVMRALALAQGVNKTAKLEARLIRNTPAGRTETDLPLKKIFANQAADPKLQDEDVLYIPVSGAKQWTDKAFTSALQMAVGVVIYGRN
jgi:polysaccharide export outer membrane protein